MFVGRSGKVLKQPGLDFMIHSMVKHMEPENQHVCAFKPAVPYISIESAFNSKKILTEMYLDTFEPIR